PVNASTRMTSGIDCLSLKDSDAKLMIAAQMHIGARNTDFQMEPYIFGRTKAGVNIFNCKKIWEKIVLAARAIASVENPADVFAIASTVHAQRAVLKFARYTGATPIAGRFTPGTLTNQIQAAFREPRLLIASCPRQDHQAIAESHYVNLPVVALCNSDASIRYVDIAVPCNNNNVHSVGLAWWLLTRQVLRIRGTIPYDTDWDVMPDLFFYRTPEEQEKEQKEDVVDQPVPVPGAVPAGLAQPVEDWGETVAPAAAAAGAPAGGVFGAVGQPTVGGGEDWGAAESWGAPVTGGATDWAASAPETSWE
uniref:Small ribosomal subunit protein uS2 n=2 Tax=Macrostomum lignano TaxID=282301 RepID=A0A1I8GAQ3_9PLAT